MDEEARKLFFWNDVNGKLLLHEVSSTSGKSSDITAFRIDNDSIFMRTF
ncbi:hypothetical protein [Flavobacterium sp. N1994]|nr:hypothetical protein [Flavobacterium sp. N1994]